MIQAFKCSNSILWPFTPTMHFEKEKGSIWVRLGLVMTLEDPLSASKKVVPGVIPSASMGRPGRHPSKVLTVYYVSAADIYCYTECRPASSRKIAPRFENRSNWKGCCGKSESKDLSCRVHVSQPQRGYVLMYLPTQAS